MIRSLVNFLRKIVRNHYMIRSLVVRDIRKRYIGSFLGLFWAVLHPLAQLVIYVFIFSIVLKARLGPEYGGVSYALWLMCGLLPWLFFSDVVNRSPEAVLEQTNLIKKTLFPSEILPLAHAAAALVNHGIMLVLLLLVFVLTGQTVGPSVLWIPVYLFGVLVFSLGLAWICAALNVFLRDIGQVLAVLVNLWFYATPVIYPAAMVPASFQRVLALNPMHIPVDGYRMALLGRTPPDLAGLAVFFLWCFGAFFVGGFIFKKLKPSFPDVL